MPRIATVGHGRHQHDASRYREKPLILKDTQCSWLINVRASHGAPLRYCKCK
ncbi:hypothetical protein ACP0HM_33365 [Escherichia coli]